MNSWLAPAGKLTRWFEGVVVIIAGLSCFLAYYLIDFVLCAKDECQALVVTLFWTLVPGLYLLLGAAVIVTGVLLIVDTSMNKLYRLGIEVTALLGVTLAGMMVFAISNELKSLI